MSTFRAPSGRVIEVSDAAPLYWVAQRVVKKIPRTSWSVVRDEVGKNPTPLSTWDVYLLHESGDRVPAGLNLKPVDKAKDEATRLRKVVTTPTR